MLPCMYFFIAFAACYLLCFSLLNGDSVSLGSGITFYIGEVGGKQASVFESLNIHIMAFL